MQLQYADTVICNLQSFFCELYALKKVFFVVICFADSKIFFFLHFVCKSFK